MINLVAVGAGGFVGSVLRYLISIFPVNETMIFPVKTFMINVAGCIAIGIIAAAASKNIEMSPHVLLFLKAGLCGGFTTFSTFGLETADLIKAGYMGTAFLYVILSVLAGVAVIFAAEYICLK